MNHALWVTKKNQICFLIKKISDCYGGDDIDWLKTYCDEVIKKNRNDIQKALDCFWDIEDRLKYNLKRNVIRGTMAKGS